MRCCNAVCHEGPEEPARVEFFFKITGEWYGLCDSCAQVIMKIVSDPANWRELPKKNSIPDRTSESTET